MSITTPKQIIPPHELTAGQVTEYTVTAGKTKIQRITFTNTDTVIRTVTVHYVLSAGTADDTNIVLNALAIGPKRSVAPPVLEAHVLELGGFISMAADVTSKITVVGTGLEIV